MGQQYYTRARHKECIDEMQDLTGIKATIYFCLNNAYKYAYRAGIKTRNKAADLSKLDWYLTWCKNHRKRLTIVDRCVFDIRYKRVTDAISDLLM